MCTPQRLATEQVASASSASKSFAETYLSRKSGNPSDFASSSNAREVQPLSPLLNADISPTSPTASWGDSPKRRSTRRKSSLRESLQDFRSDVVEDSLDRGTRFLPMIPQSDRAIQATDFRDAQIDWDQLFEEDVTGILQFVESGWFQFLTTTIIFLNAALIGIETDFDSPWFPFLEQILLAFFTVELCLRLIRSGSHFFSCAEESFFWNMLDFIIVTTGVFDQWLLPYLDSTSEAEAQDEISSSGKKHSAPRSQLFYHMRMLRLLRIIRVFRLVKMIPQLYNLSKGVFAAIQGMLWVLVFLAMGLYAVGILCTRLLGHGVLVTPSTPDCQEMLRLFSSVPSSMFALFELMSSWTLMKYVPLFEVVPILKPMFVLFYVFAAWGLLAVMTGVVSEKMIAIRQRTSDEDHKREEDRRMAARDILMNMFTRFDADGDGSMSRAECNTMLSSEECIKNLQKNTNVRVQDLQELFDWLDIDKDGNVTAYEFLQGFMWLNEPLNPKSLVKLHDKLVREVGALQKAVKGCLEDRYARLLKVIGQPLGKLHAVTLQIQSLDDTFREIRRFLEEDFEMDLKSEQTTEGLEEAEIRIARKIDEIQSRVTRLLKLKNEGKIEVIPRS